MNIFIYIYIYIYTSEDSLVYIYSPGHMSGKKLKRDESRENALVYWQVMVDKTQENEKKQF